MRCLGNPTGRRVAGYRHGCRHGTVSFVPMMGKRRPDASPGRPTAAPLTAGPPLSVERSRRAETLAKYAERAAGWSCGRRSPDAVANPGAVRCNQELASGPVGGRRAERRVVETMVQSGGNSGQSGGGSGERATTRSSGMARTERRAPGVVCVAGHTRPVGISAYELSMPLGASLRTGPKSPSDPRSGWQRVGRRPSTES